MINKGELSAKVWTPSPREIEIERKWIEKELERIGPKKLEDLIQSAVAVRQNAYQPYSKYMVGASILTTEDEIFSSCNAETVTYTETDHAERSAVTQAIAHGAAKKNKKFLQALVVSHPGESGPCGGCRQRMAEHADNCLVIDVDDKGNVQNITSLNILLPYSFKPSHLGK